MTNTPRETTLEAACKEAARLLMQAIGEQPIPVSPNTDTVTVDRKQYEQIQALIESLLSLRNTWLATDMYSDSAWCEADKLLIRYIHEECP